MSATLKDLHAAILTALRSHFGAKVVTVGAYRLAETDPVATPALLLEMEGGERGEGMGDERVPLQCRFSVHCLLSFQTKDVELEVRDFAARVFCLVQYNHWGLGGDVDDPVETVIGPGEFKPGKDGYESWYVGWEQTIHLGESVWNEDAVVVGKVYLGQGSDVGDGGQDGVGSLR
jgi:hypothetical protein